MKLLLFGNVASGKSTILNRVNSVLGFQSISIDDFRKQYGDYTLEGELLSRRKFIESIRDNCDQIVECTGYGAVGDDLFIRMKDSHEFTICLIIDSPVDVCLSRINDRNRFPPFHIDRKEIVFFVERVDAEVKSKKILNKWSTKPNVLVLQESNQSQDDLDSITKAILVYVRSYLSGMLSE